LKYIKEVGKKKIVIHCDNENLASLYKREGYTIEEEKKDK